MKRVGGRNRGKGVKRNRGKGVKKENKKRNRDIHTVKYIEVEKDREIRKRRNL